MLWGFLCGAATPTPEPDLSERAAEVGRSITDFVKAAGQKLGKATEEKRRELAEELGRGIDELRADIAVLERRMSENSKTMSAEARRELAETIDAMNRKLNDLSARLKETEAAPEKK